MTKKVLPDNHYVDNEELTKLLGEYAKNYPKPMCERLGYLIKLVVEGRASSYNFAGYSYKEDMIGDAILNCMLYCHNFDPEKSSNGFGYISGAARFAFLARMKKENKQSYIREKLSSDRHFTFQNHELGKEFLESADKILTKIEGKSKEKSKVVLDRENPDL